MRNSFRRYPDSIRSFTESSYVLFINLRSSRHRDARKKLDAAGSPSDDCVSPPLKHSRLLIFFCFTGGRIAFVLTQISWQTESFAMKLIKLCRKTGTRVFKVSALPSADVTPSFFTCWHFRLFGIRRIDLELIVRSSGRVDIRVLRLWPKPSRDAMAITSFTDRSIPFSCTIVCGVLARRTASAGKQKSRPSVRTSSMKAGDSCLAQANARSPRRVRCSTIM